MLKGIILKGFGIQTATILLLLTQAILAPIVMGVENYGAVIFSFTPVLFFTAIFEAVSQHATSKKIKGTFLYVLQFFFIIGFFIFVFYLFNGREFDVEIVMLLICSVSLLLSTWSQACYYSVNNLKGINKALFSSFLVSFLVLSISYLFDLKSIYMYYVMFSLSQISAFITLLLIDKYNKDERVIDFSIERTKLEFIVVWESISWRVNTILFTILFLYLVGVFHSTEVVGETKILFTVLTGLRYLSPYNTPMIHAYFKENKHGYLLVLKLTLFYFFCCLFAYFISFYLNDLFELPFVDFFVEYPAYFYIFAVVLSSNSIGSYFIFQGRYCSLVIASIMSFGLCCFLMFVNVSPDISFFSGLAGYIALLSVIEIYNRSSKKKNVRYENDFFR